MRNPSNHTNVLGPDGRDLHRDALSAFVDAYYPDDLALYNRHCPKANVPSESSDDDNATDGGAERRRRLVEVAGAGALGLATPASVGAR